jgi:putative membrane protein
MPVTTAALTLAHGRPARPEEWTEVAGVLLIAGLAAAYGRGVQELWTRRGRGAVLPRWRAAAFGAGLVAVLAAQWGPVAEAAERSLHGHMAQHMLLLMVAGPLLAAGGAGLPLTVAAPRRVKRWTAVVRSTAAARWVRRPINLALLAAGIHTAVLWFWHLPRPYSWAEANAPVHAAEHACFIAAAWLLWSTVLSPRADRLSAPVGFLFLFATGMTAAALGAVLTLAPGPIYPAEALAGPDPLADQQLAGLVMWVPMDVVMLVAAVTLFLRWLVTMDRRTPAERDLRPDREEVPA